MYQAYLQLNISGAPNILQLLLWDVTKYAVPAFGYALSAIGLRVTSAPATRQLRTALFWFTTQRVVVSS